MHIFMYTMFNISRFAQGIQVCLIMNENCMYTCVCANRASLIVVQSLKPPVCIACIWYTFVNRCVDVFIANPTRTALCIYALAFITGLHAAERLIYTY